MSGFLYCEKALQFIYFFLKGIGKKQNTKLSNSALLRISLPSFCCFLSSVCFCFFGRFSVSNISNIESSCEKHELCPSWSYMYHVGIVWIILDEYVLKKLPLCHFFFADLFFQPKWFRSRPSMASSTVSSQFTTTKCNAKKFCAIK